MPLLGNEDYVLLACDGFFDAVKPSEVPSLVVDALQQTGDPEGGGDAPAKHPNHAVGQMVAHELVRHAKEAGSSDNITVMLVFLRPPQQLVDQHSAAGTEQAAQKPVSQDASQLSAGETPESQTPAWRDTHRPEHSHIRGFKSSESRQSQTVTHGPQTHQKLQFSRIQESRARSEVTVEVTVYAKAVCSLCVFAYFSLPTRSSNCTFNIFNKN